MYIQYIFTTFEEAWYKNTNILTIYASTKWSGGTCQSHHYGDDKKHATCSKL